MLVMFSARQHRNYKYKFYVIHVLCKRLILHHVNQKVAQLPKKQSFVTLHCAWYMFRPLHGHPHGRI